MRTTTVVRAAADRFAAEDLSFVLGTAALLNQPTTKGLNPFRLAAEFGQVEEPGLGARGHHQTLTSALNPAVTTAGWCMATPPAPHTGTSSTRA